MSLGSTGQILFSPPDSPVQNSRTMSGPSSYVESQLWRDNVGSWAVNVFANNSLARLMFAMLGCPVIPFKAQESVKRALWSLLGVYGLQVLRFIPFTRQFERTLSAIDRQYIRDNLPIEVQEMLRDSVNE